MSSVVLAIKKSQNSDTPTALANGELAYSYSSDKLFIGQTDSSDSVVSVEYIGGKLLVEELVLTDFVENGLMYTDSTGTVVQASGTSGKVMQVATDGSPEFADLSGGGYTAAVTADYTLSVTNNGAGAYTLSGTDRNGSVSGDNASLNFNNGDVVDFDVNASGHPFWIKTATGTGTDNQASGVTNGGAEVGTVRWVVGSTGTFYYVCQYHSSMVGTITIS